MWFDTKSREKEGSQKLNTRNARFSPSISCREASETARNVSKKNEEGRKRIVQLLSKTFPKNACLNSTENRGWGRRLPFLALHCYADYIHHYEGHTSCCILHYLLFLSCPDHHPLPSKILEMTAQIVIILSEAWYRGNFY